MNNVSLAAISLVLMLSACGGNPLTGGGSPEEGGTDGLGGLVIGETDTGGTDGGGTDTGGTVTPSSPVIVPTALAENLTSAKFVTGTGGEPDTVLIKFSAISTTPLEQTWTRNTALEAKNPGYQAYYVQEDALDQFFVALAAISADGSAYAVAASNGGQFNEINRGALYGRTGDYTPPDVTQTGPGRGQVSYKGKYAGLLNGGGGRDEALPIPPDRDTSPSEIPVQPAQVTGDVFLNANFGNNIVAGTVKNRSAEIFGTEIGLEDLALTQSDITANGTFAGAVQRPVEMDPDKSQVGNYAGAFAGTDASSVAGAVDLEKVYDRNDNELDGALERGVFVLDQCGLTATAGGDCLGTAP